MHLSALSRANSVLIKSDTKAIRSTYVGDELRGAPQWPEQRRPALYWLSFFPHDANDAHFVHTIMCKHTPSAAAAAAGCARPDQIINNYHGRRPGQSYHFPRNRYIMHNTNNALISHTRWHSFGRLRERVRFLRWQINNNNVRRVVAVVCAASIRIYAAGCALAR